MNCIICWCFVSPSNHFVEFSFHRTVLCRFSLFFRCLAISLSLFFSRSPLCVIFSMFVFFYSLISILSAFRLIFWLCKSYGTLLLIFRWKRIRCSVGWLLFGWSKHIAYTQRSDTHRMCWCCFIFTLFVRVQRIELWLCSMLFIQNFIMLYDSVLCHSFYYANFVCVFFPLKCIRIVCLANLCANCNSSCCYELSGAHRSKVKNMPIGFNKRSGLTFFSFFLSSFHQRTVQIPMVCRAARYASIFRLRISF